MTTVSRASGHCSTTRAHTPRSYKPCATCFSASSSSANDSITSSETAASSRAESTSPMFIELGRVEAIYRYPVKSMRGEQLDVATLGWHGLDGDRRLGFRRTQERNDFPWLSASTLPDLLLFTPFRHEDDARIDLPTHVRTPEGKEMTVFGEELAAEIERR